VHADIHGKTAILSHQRPLRLEGHQAAVGAEGGVEAAQLNAGLGPIAAHACPDGGLGLPIMDEDVGVEVAVADDQVVGVRGERHHPAVGADRGAEAVVVALEAGAGQADPLGGLGLAVEDEDVEAIGGGGGHGDLLEDGRQQLKPGPNMHATDLRQSTSRPAARFPGRHARRLSGIEGA
jgi:hypothetical protein